MKASLVAAVFLAGFLSGLVAAAQRSESARVPAERVTGIGGVFFKARDPAALSAWYREKLGVATRDGATFAVFEWREHGEPSRAAATVWSLFRSDSDYFAPGNAGFMVNYRVRDLDRMMTQLRALGVRAEPKVAEEFNGRFAWIVDPEGNKIELWEPAPGY